MRCPKCQFDHPLQTTECLKCGIVFSKYQPAAVDVSPTPEIPPVSEALAKPPDAPVPTNPANTQTAADLVSSLAASLDADLSSQAATSPATEFKYRLLALPLALLLARWLTATGFRIVANMLAMVVHECGHAITAWLVGRWAIPTFWVTIMGQTKSWFLVLIVMGGLIFGGFLAWKARRWGWLCAAAAVLLLQINLLSAPAIMQGALVVFAGDGGAMVLATILMATFYAPRNSALYKSWGLRWALLLIGALAFMHVYRLWSGPWENLPFGQIEGGNMSDPTLLTGMYGWSVVQLVDRYLLLAKVCFTAMGAMYVWGLVTAYLAMRSPSPQSADNGLNAQPTR